MLPVWGAYIWRGLYMEGLIFGILRYVSVSEAWWDFSTEIHRQTASISAWKENRKKQLKNHMKEKARQQMSFTDWFWKVSSPNGLSVLLSDGKVF